MRILRLFTVSLLLCSLFTGCESSGSTEQPTAPEPTAPEPTPVPEVSLGGVQVHFDLVTDSLAIGRVQTQLLNESQVNRNLYLEYKITDANGRVQQYNTQEQELEAGQELSKTKLIDLTHPIIWSPEEPQVYQLTVTAFADEIKVGQQEIQASVRPEGTSDTALNQHSSGSCMPARNAFVR